MQHSLKTYAILSSEILGFSSRQRGWSLDQDQLELNAITQALADILIRKEELIAVEKVIVAARVQEDIGEGSAKQNSRKHVPASLEDIVAGITLETLALGHTGHNGLVDSIRLCTHRTNTSSMRTTPSLPRQAA